MGIFQKKRPTNPNEDMIDSSKCNFLLSNGLCGATTYGVIRKCAKDQCIFMRLLREPPKNMDYNPEEIQIPREPLRVPEEIKALSQPMFQQEVAKANPCASCGNEIEKNLPNKDTIPLCRNCRKIDLENKMKQMGVSSLK